MIQTLYYHNEYNYQVLELEGKEKGEWGFKALKQMIKINFKLVSSHHYQLSSGVQHWQHY